MAAAMAKVLRGRRSGSPSDFQQMVPAIYRRRMQEGVLAPLLGSSPATPAAGMARLMHKRCGGDPSQLSALDKLKSTYAKTSGIYQPHVTKSSVLHMSGRLDNIANELSIYQEHWYLPVCLAGIIGFLAVDAFIQSDDKKKKRSENHVSSINQFLWDAIALEQSVRHIEHALALKVAVREGSAQPPTKCK